MFKYQNKKDKSQYMEEDEWTEFRNEPMNFRQTNKESGFLGKSHRDKPSFISHNSLNPEQDFQSFKKKLGKPSHFYESKKEKFYPEKDHFPKGNKILYNSEQFGQHLGKENYPRKPRDYGDRDRYVQDNLWDKQKSNKLVSV